MSAPKLPRIADCRDCADPIRFVKLDTGTVMPVNPKPGHDGTVCARVIGARLHGYVISRDRAPGLGYPLRFVPHAATCEAKQPRPKPVTVPDPGLF